MCTGYIPGQYEEEDGHYKVCKDHVYPHIQGERGHEGEELRVLLPGLPVEDADPEGHERIGEVHSLFSLISDGQVSYSKVSFLQQMWL